MAGSLLETFEAALARAGGRLVRAGRRKDPRAFASKEHPGASVGVDDADLLVAETGTVVRSYPDRESARVSLTPEVSVFVAKEDSLVANLPEALARLAPAHREGRAYTVLVTGPSRTADIEKTLVIPAHGPKELLVWWRGA
jgi:L-lactate dehydrogenase complex protein LldG